MSWLTAASPFVSFPTRPIPDRLRCYQTGPFSTYPTFDGIYPGVVADAGFFDEAWKFKTILGEALEPSRNQERIAANAVRLIVFSSQSTEFKAPKLVPSKDSYVGTRACIF